MIGREAIAIINLLLKQQQRGTLKTLEAEIITQVWERKSYHAIARELGYEPEYIKQVAARLWKLLSALVGEKVSKVNLGSILQRYQPSSTSIDWGEAIDVSHFNGRTAELEMFGRWLSGEETSPCRLLAILGMGGIGKTSLAVKLAQQVRDDYRLVVWRSVKDAPPLPELLQDLIKVLSHHQDLCLPDRTSQQISKLLQYLRSTRCLIVFDNFETILAGRQRSGTYLAGYEAYGELLLRVGEIPHSSCLILTSREKPAEVAALAGDNLPVKSYVLLGIDLVSAKRILATKGISGSQRDAETLIQGYQGNPLALKIASTSIVDLFAGDIRQFLEQGSIVFNGIRHLLDRQIERLSAIETQIMYWLAIEREPVTASTLHTDLQPTVSKASLLEALESLCWRSAIEKVNPTLGAKKEAYFTLPPVVMEYMTDRLIERTTQALLTGQVENLNRYALIKAQAKDYIRDSQIRVILDPIAGNLHSHFKNFTSIEQNCQKLLETLRQHYRNVAGYAAGNLINLLRHLNIDLTGYDFSDLAVWQADFQGVNLHRVNFSRADLSYSRFTSALNNSIWVEFSPDGTQLASCDANGSIRLWQVDNGREILSLEGHLSWVWAVRFSPNGNWLASCSGDYSIRLWDARTGLCLGTFLGHTSSVVAVSFSPDGKQIASLSLDCTVKIWEIQSRECLVTIDRVGGRSIAFSPDGKLLAIVLQDQTTIALWDIERQEITQTFKGHTDTIWSLAFSPDGTLLASGSGDQTARLWQVAAGECDAIIPSSMGRICTLAFSPTDSLLGLGGDSGSISLWDFRQQTVRQTLQGHNSRLCSIAFAPDGRFLASSAEDRTIRRWLVKTGQCTSILQGYNNRIRAMAIDSTGLLAYACNDSIVLRHLTDESHLAQLPRHLGEIYSIAFDPNGRWLASGCNDGIASVWDVKTAKCLKSFVAHTGSIYKVLFHPTQSLLISVGDDRTIRIWELSTFRCLHVLTGHTGWIYSAAVSSDGRYLATGSDREFKLWDTNTWQCLRTIPAHEGWVWTLAINPQDGTLASGGFDRAIRIWDVDTGQCLRTLTGHTKAITDLLYTPSGEQLISCSRDRTIALWDLDTGNFKTFEGHQGWVWSIGLFASNTTHLPPQTLISCCFRQNFSRRGKVLLR